MAAKRVFEGLTVVTVGLILLANTLGMLPWSVWWNILMLWPLLLVAAGIDILGRAVDSTALRVLGSLVVIGGLVFGALAGSGRIALPAFDAAERGRTFSLSEPRAQASSARVDVDAGMTRLRIGAGDQLATVEGRTAFGEPRLRVTDEGGVPSVEIGSSEDGTFIPFGVGPRSFLDVTLDRTVIWERMKVDAGMSDVGIDLTGLAVSSLDLDVGMSSVTVTFSPSPGEADVKLSGGMSSFRLLVPRSLGVELRVDNGLGSVNVPDGWERVAGDGRFEGTWRSDGYAASAERLRLIVDTGMSSVDVVRY